MKNICILKHYDHERLETMVNDWINTFDIDVIDVKYQYVSGAEAEEHVVVVIYRAKDELADE